MSDTESLLVDAVREKPPTAAASALSALRAAGPSLPARAASFNIQVGLERLTSRALPALRYRMRHLGWTGVLGIASIVIAAVASVAFLLPAHQSIGSLSSQLLTTSRIAPAPASQSLSPRQFAGALPGRAQVPSLLKTVLEQADQAGITLDKGKYTFAPASGSRLARYSFEFPVKADYEHIRTFINNSLLAIPALGLEKLHIERKSVGDTTVNAELGFVIYLRGGA